MDAMDASALNQTKLVIWDLDDTFWDGTLSEGGICFREEMLSAVIDLTRHGIISSIASNNDPGETRATLEAHGAWEYFLFPQIGWHSKVDMVRSILADVKLRPENAVFLDDKPRLREAVMTGVPGLLEATSAQRFAAAFRLWGAERLHTDEQLSRFHQYKLLERRLSAQRLLSMEGPGLPEDFLRHSRIRCAVVPVSEEIFERVHELIHRTNQLNFTDKRIDRDELRQLVCGEDTECRAVQVEDVYGDYGICGFYAIRRGPAPLITHFLFSCRILHMGIEGALYARLGRPAIDCCQRQLAAMERVRADAVAVDWVDVRDAETVHGSSQAEPAAAGGKARVVLIGPCDLSAVAHGVRIWCSGLIDTNSRLMFVNDEGKHITHFGHCAFLDMALRPEIARRHREVLSALPWFDPMLLDIDFLDDGLPTTIVVSSVRNAQCAEYLHKSGAFTVPLDYFRFGGRDVTQRTNWDFISGHIADYHGTCPDGFLQWFSERFRWLGLPSTERYLTSLVRLVAKLPPASRLILINVPDVEHVTIYTRSQAEEDLVAAWKEQHRRINRAIQQCTQQFAGRVGVIDLNRHISSEADFADEDSTASAAYECFYRFYHYQRRVLVGVGVDLLQLMASWGMIEITPQTITELASRAITNSR
jgi:FkbH-like protein